MDFPWALSALGNGERLTRRRWGNRNTYVLRHAGYVEGLAVGPALAAATGLSAGTVIRMQPHYLVCLEDGSYAPWFPTQIDMNAQDWELV